MLSRPALPSAALQLAPLLLLAALALSLRAVDQPELAALVGLGGLAACAGRRMRRAARLAVAIGLAALAAWLWLHAGAMWMLVRLLPALGMLMMAVHFGATLLPGQEPLITRYTRYDHGVRLEECASYTRGLTVLWTLLFLALTPLYAVTLLGLPPFHAAIDPASVLSASAVLMLVFFLGEHVVRTLRFPHFGLATPVRTMRAVIAATMARYA